MKNLSKYVLEDLLRDKEISDILKSGNFLFFKDLKPGMILRSTFDDREYKLIRKFQNPETARAGLDNIEELFSESYQKETSTGPTFIGSLPLVLVEVDGIEEIYVYAPEKFEALETLVAHK